MPVTIRRAATLLALALAAPSATAFGQDRARVAFDTIVSVEDFEAADPPQVVGLNFDALLMTRIAGNLYGVVRPMARRLFDGRWTRQICQIALRYESPQRLPVRLEFGYLSSPVGMGTLEARADDNPTVQIHPYYFQPLPSFEARTPRVQLMSTVYPFGGQVSVSRTRWDARVAFVDSSATRVRRVISRNNPPRMAQIALGAGVTPYVGVRLGGSFMHGPYARAREVADARRGDRTATVATIEGEYAFRYTKLTGEWVRDSFETASSPAVARPHETSSKA